MDARAVADQPTLDLVKQFSRLIEFGQYTTARAHCGELLRREPHNAMLHEYERVLRQAEDLLAAPDDADSSSSDDDDDDDDDVSLVDDQDSLDGAEDGSSWAADSESDGEGKHGGEGKR